MPVFYKRWAVIVFDPLAWPTYQLGQQSVSSRCAAAAVTHSSRRQLYLNNLSKQLLQFASCLHSFSLITQIQAHRNILTKGISILLSVTWGYHYLQCPSQISVHKSAKKSETKGALYVPELGWKSSLIYSFVKKSSDSCWYIHGYTPYRYSLQLIRHTFKR